MLAELVIWFRQIFCDHIFEYKEYICTDTKQLHSSARGLYNVEYQVPYVIRTCRHCGYHKCYRRCS